MSYRETLYKWAAAQVPPTFYSGDYATYSPADLPVHTLKTVTGVTVYQDPGYKHSSYTMEDPHVDVTIAYECHCGHRMHRDVDIESMGDLLTQLFAIEENS